MAVHGSSHPRSSRVLSRLGTAVAPATRDPACRSPEVLRDVVRRRGRSAVTGRTRRAPASCATPGAGHPASPFEVLASLGPGQRGSLGLPGPLPEAPASGLTAAPTDGGWTGPVGVLGTGHTAGGIVETVAPSGRPVRVLARSEASGARLLGALGKRLIRAVSRGRLDEGTRAEVFGRVSLTHHAAALAGSDVVIEAVAEDLAVEAAVLGAVDAALRRRCRWRSAPRPSVSVTCAPSVPSGRPVLALHLVDPAQVMGLVEVAVPDDVPDAAGLQTTASAWARDLDEAGLSARQIADHLGHNRPSLTQGRLHGPPARPGVVRGAVDPRRAPAAHPGGVAVAVAAPRHAGATAPRLSHPRHPDRRRRHRSHLTARPGYTRAARPDGHRARRGRRTARLSMEEDGLAVPAGVSGRSRQDPVAELSPRAVTTRQAPLLLPDSRGSALPLHSVGLPGADGTGSNSTIRAPLHPTAATPSQAGQDSRVIHSLTATSLVTPAVCSQRTGCPPASRNVSAVVVARLQDHQVLTVHEVHQPVLLGDPP
jgi:3-hydroxybutyryl-CoA dehydrogenase